MKSFDDEGIRLEIVKRVLTEPYDIAGGVSNELRIHDNVKITSELRGVQLQPLIGYELLLS